MPIDEYGLMPSNALMTQLPMAAPMPAYGTLPGGGAPLATSPTMNPLAAALSGRSLAMHLRANYSPATIPQPRPQQQEPTKPGTDPKKKRGLAALAASLALSQGGPMGLLSLIR